MHKLGSILDPADQRAWMGDAAPRSLPPVSAATWEAAVGSRIAQRAEPVRLERGILHVRVSTAAWANELALLADDILAQLRQRGVEVASLRFGVGPITRPRLWPRDPPRPAAPRYVPLPAVLRDKVARVRDDGLRAALADAAAKMLSIPKK